MSQQTNPLDASEALRRYVDARDDLDATPATRARLWREYWLAVEAERKEKTREPT